MNAVMNSNAIRLPERSVPYRLGGVYEIREDGLVTGLILDVDGAELRFVVDPDTDSLEVEVQDGDGINGAPRIRTTALEAFVGRELTWTWAATNSQGYSDSNLLAFDGIIPNVVIHAIGSEVRTYRIASTAP